MTDIQTTIIIAMAAVLAAFVTGVISLVNLIVSKDMKVSELRQDWINSLRSEISHYLATANSIATEWRCHDDKTNAVSFLSKQIKLINEVDSLSNKIRLRLNPIEHEDTITLVNDIQRFLSSPEILSEYTVFHAHTERLTVSTQEILQSEWKRVKAGEPSYKILKIVSIIFLLVVLAVSSLIYSQALP